MGSKLGRISVLSRRATPVKISSVYDGSMCRARSCDDYRYPYSIFSDSVVYMPSRGVTSTICRTSINAGAASHGALATRRRGPTNWESIIRRTNDIRGSHSHVVRSLMAGYNVVFRGLLRLNPLVLIQSPACDVHYAMIGDGHICGETTGNKTPGSFAHNYSQHNVPCCIVQRNWVTVRAGGRRKGACAVRRLL